MRPLLEARCGPAAPEPDGAARGADRVQLEDFQVMRSEPGRRMEPRLRSLSVCFILIYQGETTPPPRKYAHEKLERRKKKKRRRLDSFLLWSPVFPPLKFLICSSKIEVFSGCLAIHYYYHYYFVDWNCWFGRGKLIWVLFPAHLSWAANRGHVSNWSDFNK